MQGKTVLNNIRISNSSVGVMNTGELARIDAVITLTKDTDCENIGQLLGQLTQVIIDSKDADSNAKREMLESLTKIFLRHASQIFRLQDCLCHTRC
jgi:hypothetical protein